MKYLSIKVRRKRVIVPCEEIIYMEKMARKIILYTANNRLMFYGKFSEIIPLLDGCFDNSHSSYLINMSHITGIMDDGVCMSNGAFITMGRKCLNETKKAYDKYMNTYSAKK